MQIFVPLLALALGACEGGRGESPAPQAGGDQGPRIAALSPAIAIILDDLGLSDRLVARHAFDEYSERSVPVAGDQGGVDYERLLRAEPTHVLLQWGARQPPRRLGELAGEQGWVVVDYPMRTLEDIREATRDLGKRFDRTQAAAALLERMDEAWAPASPELARRVGRVLPLYWTNPPGAAGPGSFHHQLLEAMGLTPALQDGPAYIEIDPEDLRRLDPDTIVLFAPGAEPADLSEMLSPLERLDLRAVREGRVALINHPWSQIPGTSMIETAQRTREALRKLTAP